MRNSARFIPSLFTILNLFCGFMSIINSANLDMNQACLFIIYASLFDAFDGVVARFTGTSSKFGVELDSLSDVISFGAAPSFILYRFYFYDLNGIGIAVSSLILIFSALRLARFNIQTVGFDKTYFSGVPAPLSALTVSSFFLFYFNNNFSVEVSRIIVYVLTLLLPVLLVSKFKYDPLPKFSIREVRKRPVRYIFLLLVIILIAATKGEGLFAFCLFYISTGIIRSIYYFFRKTFLKKKIAEHPGESLNY